MSDDREENWLSAARMAFAFLSNFGLDEVEASTLPGGAAMRFAKRGGAFVELMLVPREGITSCRLGHDLASDIMSSGELAALNGTTEGRYFTRLRRTAAPPGESVDEFILRGLAGLLREFGEAVMMDDITAFERLKDLRAMGYDEWIRRYVPV